MVAVNRQKVAQHHHDEPRPAQWPHGREAGSSHADIQQMAAAIARSRAQERHAMIEAAAYLRAEQRGFEPGHELEDWLQAEAEVAGLPEFSVALSQPEYAVGRAV